VSAPHHQTGSTRYPPHGSKRQHENRNSHGLRQVPQSAVHRRRAYDEIARAVGGENIAEA